MFRKSVLWTFLPLSLTLAQNPPAPPPEPQAAPASEPPSQAYVRRFSVGGTLSYLPFQFTTINSIDQTLTANPPGHVSANSSPTKYHFSPALNFQVALTEHIAIVVNGVYRRVAYAANWDYLLGILDPTSAVDNRSPFSVTEDTRAKFIDIPVLLRYYDKGRHRPGKRFFLEIGPTMRLVRYIHTTRNIIDPEGNITTDTTPYSPRYKNLPGITAGAGMQFIDPVGIRVIPEVRLTQWRGATFDTAPTRSNRSQLEVMISLNF